MDVAHKHFYYPASDHTQTKIKKTTKKKDIFACLQADTNHMGGYPQR